MKKFTAFFSAFFILTMLVFTGCSSNSDSVGTAKPASDKKTIGPTATVYTTLTNDTIFDENEFSIAIPKDATFDKSGRYYTWWTYFNNYSVNISVSINNGISDLNYVEKYENMIASSLDTGLGGKGKMNTEYSKVTLNGKNAILFTGKGTEEFNADFDYYFVESNNGILMLMTIRKYEDNDPQTLKDSRTVLDNILSTLIIK